MILVKWQYDAICYFLVCDVLIYLMVKFILLKKNEKLQTHCN